MPIAQVPKRGEIWLVNFDPAVGSEIRKLRPALVVSPNAVGRLPLRIVVPITDWKPQYSSFPWINELQPSPTNGLIKPSGADAFQVKSISLNRFARKLGEVSTATVASIASSIALCVGVKY